MTPEQKRKFNTLAGTTFILGGLIAWAFTGYFATTPNPPKPAPIMPTATVDLASCRSVLTTLGFSASVMGREVSVFEEQGDDPKTQLERVTMAAAVCKLSLKSFCMGEGCERQGVSFILEPVDVKASTPDAKAPPAAAPLPKK